MSSKLVEFEGIDGSGKTSAMKYFVDSLRAKGFRVLDTREVGSPYIPVCVKLREIILNPEYKMDGKSMEYVFAAMRVENQKFYDSVAHEYDFIVSDRGLLSHLAYTDHNVNEEFTRKLYLDLVTTHTYAPDTVMFLLIRPEEALKRRTLRNGFVDVIEAKGPEFQRRVYGSFLKYIDKLNLNVQYVNANEDLEGVRKQLDSILNQIVPKHEK